MADGKTRDATHEDLKRGAVLRWVAEDGGAVPPFSDSTIVKVVPSAKEPGNPDECEVHLCRPMVHADRFGGWSASFEQYSVRAGRLVEKSSRLKLVIMDRGNAADYLRS